MPYLDDKSWRELLDLAVAAGVRLPTAVVEAEVARLIESGADESRHSLARRLGRDVSRISRIWSKTLERNTSATPGPVLTPDIEASRNTSATPAQNSALVEPEKAQHSAQVGGLFSDGHDNCNIRAPLHGSTSGACRPPPAPIGAAPADAVAVCVLDVGGAVISEEPPILFAPPAPLRTADRGGRAEDPEIRRLHDLWCDLGKRDRVLKATIDGIAARVKSHSVAEVESLIRWLWTSPHQRAAYLRDQGYANGATPWRPANFDQYLELSKIPLESLHNIESDTNLIFARLVFGGHDAK